MRALSHSCRRSRRNPQSGMALLLAIAVMLLLSVLGATVLELASRDIRATGRVDVKNQVFYAADRAATFGQHAVDQITDDIESSMKGQTWPITDSSLRTRTLEGMDSGSITYVGDGEVPEEGNSQANPATGFVFQIEAVATDNTAAPFRVGVDMAYLKVINPNQGSSGKTVSSSDLKKLAGEAAK